MQGYGGRGAVTSTMFAIAYGDTHISTYGVVFYHHDSYEVDTW